MVNNVLKAVTLEEAGNERACPIGVLGSLVIARQGNFRC